MPNEDKPPVPSNPLSQRIEAILSQYETFHRVRWLNMPIGTLGKELSSLEAKQEILDAIEESRKHLALECPRCGGTTVPTGYKSVEAFRRMIPDEIKSDHKTDTDHWNQAYGWNRLRTLILAHLGE